MMTQTTRRALLGAFPLALVAPGLACAQANWPDRPVRVLNPGSPGAFNDIFGRTVSDRLGAVLGQPFITQNNPGAGGALATAQLARATPDGNTLAVANLSTLIFNRLLKPDVGYEPTRDFTAVAVGARLMNMIAVHPGSGINSVADLIARARAAGGRLAYATSGIGSSPHLAAELFAQQAGGVQFQHVPYRGSAPAVSDAVAGNVPVVWDNVPNVLPQIEAGQLRPIAVTGATRHPSLPNVPTLREAGLPQFEMYVWFGIVAPAGTPAPIVQRLAAEVMRAVEVPEVAARLRVTGAEPWPQGPDAFATLIRAEVEKWEPIVRASGARID